MSEKDMFIWMLNNTEEKLNEKDECISEAAAENNDTSEKKAQA